MSKNVNNDVKMNPPIAYGIFDGEVILGTDFWQKPDVTHTTFCRNVIGIENTASAVFG